MVDLRTKNFGTKIRIKHLDVDRFDTLPFDGKDVIVSKFGVLTRYEDGTVGVSIHFMDEPDAENKRYGYWMHELTQDMTIISWAKRHENITHSMDIYRHHASKIKGNEK